MNDQDIKKLIKQGREVKPASNGEWACIHRQIQTPSKGTFLFNWSSIRFRMALVATCCAAFVAVFYFFIQSKREMDRVAASEFLLEDSYFSPIPGDLSLLDN